MILIQHRHHIEEFISIRPVSEIMFIYVAIMHKTKTAIILRTSWINNGRR